MFTMALVKSCRICTVDNCEPNAWACERSVVSAAVNSPLAAVMSEAAAQLLVALLIESPVAVESTALTVTLDVFLSFN